VREHRRTGAPDRKRQFRREIGVGDAADAVGTE
jgi:hypothetical protein